MLLQNISHGRRSALIAIKDPEVGHCSSFRSAHRCFVPIPQPETGMFQDVTLQQAAFCFSILNTRIFRLHTHAAARLYIAITAPEFAHFSSVGATHGCFVPIPQLETGYFQAWTEIKGQIIAGARDLRAGLSIPAPTVRLSKPLQTSNFPSIAVSDQHMGYVYRSRS